METGQRDQLSFNDIRLMNRIYCSNTCGRNLPCQRGGYTDPRKWVLQKKICKEITNAILDATDVDAPMGSLVWENLLIRIIKLELYVMLAPPQSFALISPNCSPLELSTMFRPFHP